MDLEGNGISLAFLNNYIKNIGVLIVVLLSILVIFIINNKELIKQEKYKIILKRNWSKYKTTIIKEELLYFIFPAIVASLPMALISYFPPRAFLAYELMFMIVLSNNVIIIADYLEEKTAFLIVVSIFLTLIIFGRFSPSTLAQIKYIIPYKDKVTSQYEAAVKNGQKDVIVSKFAYMYWIHRNDYINIDNFFPEVDYRMPVNLLISQNYGFERLTAVGDNEYLIEITVDLEGLDHYEIINKDTGENVGFYKYDKEMRYCIPKEKLKCFVLDCRSNDLENHILKYRVRSIEDDITENVALDDIIIY